MIGKRKPRPDLTSLFAEDPRASVTIAANIIVFKTGKGRFTAICGGKGLVPMQYESFNWHDAAHVAIHRTAGARRRKKLR